MQLFLATLLTSAGAAGTIVDVANATPELATFAAAVQVGGLVDTLNMGLNKDLRPRAPFTVFAPTNAAFSALPAGPGAGGGLSASDLFKPQNVGELDGVLTYHVVQGSVRAADLVDGAVLETVQGGRITATVNATGVFVNDALVTTADVLASNGVVHVVDTVLLPQPQPQAAAAAAAAALALVTFDGAAGTTHKWEAVNDPVMGGQSNSTFTVAGGVGVFDGEVKIVPALKAAGFCNAETAGKSAFPDASAFDALSFKVRNTGHLTGVQLTVTTKDSGGVLRHGDYQGSFTVPSDGKVHDAVVPWKDFTCNWRGEKIKCPDMQGEMAKIEQVGLSFGQAPNVPGQFHIEIMSVSAVSL